MASQRVEIRGDASTKPGSSEDPSLLRATNAGRRTATEFELLQERVRNNPHDTESWRRLVANARESGNTEKVGAAYDALLEQYPNTTSSTWEKQQKDDAIRKVLHRAVQIPLQNVETLWSELESFENSLNRTTAKKFMQDLSPAYIQAKSSLRELVRLTAPICPSSIPLPPGQLPDLFLPTVPSFTSRERQNVGRWKAYLKWEQSNPLELEEKDRATLVTRIQMAYRKAVISMRYYPELWFMAYNWRASIEKHEEALATLKAGLKANPNSFILNFEIAEILERKTEYKEVHETYQNFLTTLRAELTTLEEAEKARVVAEAAAANTQEGDENGPLTQSTQPSSSQASSLSDELIERRKEYGLVHIMYMRFARRAEGTAAFRTAFAEARKDPSAPWLIFDAAALTEYHSNGDRDLAIRIFQLGMKRYENDKDYVLRYLGFLISVNDQTNARALFERIISSFQPSDARPIWECWARYENQYGDLETIQKLEKRIAEAYPNDTPIKLFAQRHMYLNIDTIAAQDLGYARAKKEVTAVNSLESVNSSGSSQGIKRRTTEDAIGSDSASGGPKGRDSRDHGGNKRQRSSSLSKGRHDGRRRSIERSSHRGGGRATERERERERQRDKEPREEKSILPATITAMLTKLPDSEYFDGPVFQTDDLMSILRGAVIPSTGAAGNAGHGVRTRSPSFRNTGTVSSACTDDICS
ncbi:mRNA 3'-end-processing protein rna14 [Marasmius crinis-equi]|uniref:mRNA 3'-end-processing protein RNA14 n=1 Tax=Marasmius crinis-equi TaxID=585013 RepID=A0ABR3FVC5_9AGAR